MKRTATFLALLAIGGSSAAAAEREAPPCPERWPTWATFRRGSPPGSLYVIRPDGGGLRRLGAGGNPAWSRNGRFLAFVGPDDATWVMRANGTGRRRITSRVGNGDQDVDWAPDGRRLVIAGSSEAGALTLFVKVLRGGPRRHLRASGNAYAPDWSPNGRLIAFMRPTADNAEDLFVIRPDGLGVRRLTVAPGITN